MIGKIVFPSFVEQPTSENGLRLWVEGDPRDPAICCSLSKLMAIVSSLPRSRTCPRCCHYACNRATRFVIG